MDLDPSQKQESTLVDFDPDFSFDGSIHDRKEHLFDLLYGLYQKYINDRQTSTCEHFVHCPSSHRMRRILVKYHEIQCGELYLKDAIDSIFHDTYSAADLLDDFHQILDVHRVNDDPVQFEACYEFMENVDDTKQSIICDIKKCRNAHRYYSRTTGTEQQYECADYRESILMRIHCYFLHSQDTVRLRRNERVAIESKFDDLAEKRKMKMNIMRKKREGVVSLTDTEAVNKFSNIPLDPGLESQANSLFDTEVKYDEIQESEDDMNTGGECEKILAKFCRNTGCSLLVGAVLLKDSNWDINRAMNLLQNISDEVLHALCNSEKVDLRSNRDIVHTDGVQCWYWDNIDTMPQNAVRVHRRHPTLKEEMYNDPSHRIWRKQWADLYRECQVLMQTEKARKLTANGNGVDLYGIKASDLFTMRHLMALKIYTGFTKLNKMCCEHFRLKRLIGNIFETRESLGFRNSKFWNLGKLLIECVQCFGNFMDKNHVYQRGVSESFLFESFVSRHHTPLSTSTNVCFLSLHVTFSIMT